MRDWYLKGVDYETNRMCLQREFSKSQSLTPMFTIYDKGKKK